MRVPATKQATTSVPVPASCRAVKAPLRTPLVGTDRVIPLLTTVSSPPSSIALAPVANVSPSRSIVSPATKLLTAF